METYNKKQKNNCNSIDWKKLHELVEADEEREIQEECIRVKEEELNRKACDIAQPGVKINWWGGSESVANTGKQEFRDVFNLGRDMKKDFKFMFDALFPGVQDPGRRKQDPDYGTDFKDEGGFLNDQTKGGFLPEDKKAIEKAAWNSKVVIGPNITELKCPHYVEENGDGSDDSADEMIGYSYPLYEDTEEEQVNVHLCEECNAILASKMMEQLALELFAKNYK